MADNFAITDMDVRTQCLRDAGGDFHKAAALYQAIGPLEDYVSMQMIACLVARVRRGRNIGHKIMTMLEDELRKGGWRSRSGRVIFPRAQLHTAAQHILSLPGVGFGRAHSIRCAFEEFGIKI